MNIDRIYSLLVAVNTIGTKRGAARMHPVVAVALFKGIDMFSTYLRLNLPVWATPRDVIRATYGRLKPSARARAHRGPRHAILRDMLGHHEAARALYERAMG